MNDDLLGLPCSFCLKSTEAETDYALTVSVLVNNRLFSETFNFKKGEDEVRTVVRALNLLRRGAKGLARQIINSVEENTDG